MSKVNRRKAIRNLSMGIGAIGFGGTVFSQSVSKNILNSFRDGLKGNINHAVCRWCYRNIELEEFAEKIK